MSDLPPFAPVLAEALSHHSEARLRARFPVARSAAELAAQPDAHLLITMARRIFSAGLKLSLIDRKWPGILAAFDDFDVATVAAYDAEKVGALLEDTRIVRHPGKVRALVHNAGVLRALAAEHGSATAWLARWPADDPVGLWHALSGRCQQLGGMSAPLVLRSFGRDTFLLTGDVLATLARHGLYTGKGTGKRDQRQIQDLFRHWRASEGLSFGALSVVCAAATGPR